jgi:hypothetical protein
MSDGGVHRGRPKSLSSAVAEGGLPLQTVSGGTPVEALIHFMLGVRATGILGHLPSHNTPVHLCAMLTLRAWCYYGPALAFIHTGLFIPRVLPGIHMHAVV